MSSAALATSMSSLSSSLVTSPNSGPHIPPSSIKSTVMVSTSSLSPSFPNTTAPPATTTKTPTTTTTTTPVSTTTTSAQATIAQLQEKWNETLSSPTFQSIRFVGQWKSSSATTTTAATAPTSTSSSTTAAAAVSTTTPKTSSSSTTTTTANPKTTASSSLSLLTGKFYGNSSSSNNNTTLQQQQRRETWIHERYGAALQNVHRQVYPMVIDKALLHELQQQLRSEQAVTNNVLRMTIHSKLVQIQQGRIVQQQALAKQLQTLNLGTKQQQHCHSPPHPNHQATKQQQYGTMQKPSVLLQQEQDDSTLTLNSTKTFNSVASSVLHESSVPMTVAH